MSEKKINLEEIIEKYRLDTDHYADQDFTESAIEKICLEFGAKLLELAAENAEIIEIPTMSYFIKVVNKQSILDTIKQVE